MASNAGATKSSFGIGVTTLITIFMVLLLTTFAVLALAVARYDNVLSNQSMGASANYYAADLEACRWVADLQSLTSNNPQTEWESLISTDLSGSTVEVSALSDDSSVTLVCWRSFTIDERSELRVGVEISDNGELTIIEWRSISARFSPSEAR
jgi:hypothetical protein